MDTQLILLSILILLILVNIFKDKFFGSSENETIIHAFKMDVQQQLFNLDQQMTNSFSNNRAEFARFGKNNQDTLGQRLDQFSKHQSRSMELLQKQIHELVEQYHTTGQNITNNLERVKKEWSDRISKLHDDNHMQLEKMRQVVDEKLQNTLEKRLGSSFELVSKHLEAVQKGLGEMQALAHGVGDLKKVLSNVKTRGVLGEMQLANILEQLLAVEQYSLNVATVPGSNQFVEFAIRMPGSKQDGKEVWLPIDSKFPLDRYQALQDAYELGELQAIEQAQKELINTVKLMAKDIRDKYISPPHTTDFGILFLPIEGLYAEVVRHPGLLEELQRVYKIMIAGPSNLAAFLNSIQMGFRSLAIEKRSSEVWEILSSVKTEFGKFSDVIDKVQIKLNQASKTIDQVGVRSRAIERNLRSVESLPEGKKQAKLTEA